jgi:hypothetical protein
MTTKAPDLQQLSDDTLLEHVVEIMLHDGPPSPQDKQDLNAINQEFIRRDSLSYLPSGR